MCFQHMIHRVWHITTITQAGPISGDDFTDIFTAAPQNKAQMIYE